MRTKNSFYNMIGVMALYFAKVVLALAGKTCLIRIMGDEYNGINALFSSIISMLSIAELGIGSAIIYNLYQPVKEDDKEKIKSIMLFYRTCYTAISGIVFVLGLCMTPFIKGLIGEINIEDNVYILFYLFLLDATMSYMLTYKRSIFYADQKNYIISICDIGYTVVLQTFQIATLFSTHNFILYLIVGIICRVTENVVIQYLANKKYPYLKEKNVTRLPVTVRNDIIKKVKGLLFHKIGSYIVFGTDNMIISRMVNIIAEGLYSNYLTIINPLSNIIAQMITALQASVGNLLVDGDKEKNYSIYKKIALLNFWLYTTASICFYHLIQNFMLLWLGKDYLFSNLVIFVLTINFWQTGMRGAIGVFKNAAGIYYEDRYIPLIESMVNLVLSIMLTKMYGIIGVFLGTFFSSLVIYLYSFPVLVYKPIFNKGYRNYITEMLKYLVEWVFCFGVVFIVGIGIEKISLKNKIIFFVIKLIIVFSSVNVVLILENHKKEEYKYYKNMIFNKVFNK